MWSVATTRSPSIMGDLSLIPLSLNRLIRILVFILRKGYCRACWSCVVDGNQQSRNHIWSKEFNAEFVPENTVPKHQVAEAFWCAEAFRSSFAISLGWSETSMPPAKRGSFPSSFDTEQQLVCKQAAILLHHYTRMLGGDPSSRINRINGNVIMTVYPLTSYHRGCCLLVLLEWLKYRTKEVSSAKNGLQARKQLSPELKKNPWSARYALFDATCDVCPSFHVNVRMTYRHFFDRHSSLSSSQSSTSSSAQHRHTNTMTNTTNSFPAPARGNSIWYSCLDVFHVFSCLR